MSARDHFSLRPMREGDLRTVLSWRNSERIRAVSLSSHEIAWEEHLAWYERSKNDDSIYPMLFECRGQPAGVVNFTGIDRPAGWAGWGFYLGDPNAPKGAASAMGFLALNYAFGGLGLQKLVGRSFVSNEASLQYHRRLGFREIEVEDERVQKGGDMLEVMRLELPVERWRELSPSLEQAIFSEAEA
jgi:UDP-4-amino-4,6-dideoxy-N-acetyl-beta-L-altrosamine N-acetyltransferase